jgi:hypothetical protein
VILGNVQKLPGGDLSPPRGLALRRRGEVIQLSISCGRLLALPRSFHEGTDLTLAGRFKPRERMSRSGTRCGPFSASTRGLRR